jgi:hypothetical protein
MSVARPGTTCVINWIPSKLIVRSIAFGCDYSLYPSLLTEDQNLKGAVNDFLTQLGDVPMPETRLSIIVGGETALKLEVVPGLLGSRNVFFIHYNLLFHLVFWPAPSLITQAANDIDDLYQTVLTSFLFLQ